MSAASEEHGTLREYRFGCRCPLCRAANAQSAREWRERRRLRDGRPYVSPSEREHGRRRRRRIGRGPVNLDSPSLGGGGAERFDPDGFLGFLERQRAIDERIVASVVEGTPASSPWSVRRSESADEDGVFTAVQAATSGAIRTIVARRPTEEEIWRVTHEPVREAA